MNKQASVNPTLTNKRVIILGGSSGIGLATAKAAAANGASVVIVSSNQQRINEALAQLPEGSTGHTANLNDEASIQQLFTDLGQFDHLVFTAGENLQLSNIADINIADARAFFNLRYWGAVTAVKYATPYINAGGSITLTSGTAGSRPQAGWGMGASICAAMEGFTRAMAIELAPTRVNIVCPGFVRTPLWNNIQDDQREAMYTAVGNMLPVKHVGEAGEIAQTYLYLMQQTFSTGQRVIVDGGGVLV